MTRPIGVEIFYWMDRWSDDQSEYFWRAADCGFEGVEISLVPGIDLDISKLAAVASNHGLRVVCSTGLNEDLDIGSANAGVRAAGTRHLRRCLEQAAELHSPILGGVTYAPWMFFPDGPLDDRRHRAAESLAEVATTADEVGVDLCLEILNRFETFMFNTVEGCLEFIDQIGEPSVKVELDTFHMSIEEDDLSGAIRSAGARLGHVQVASNNRRAPQYGSIDWRGVKAALDEVGYEGWLIFETFPNPAAETGRSTHTWRPLTKDADRDAADAASFMKRTLS